MQLKEIIKNASLMLGKLDVVKYLEDDYLYTEFENSLIEELLALIEQNCFVFYSGMAMGFDIIAAETILLLKNAYPNLFEVFHRIRVYRHSGDHLKLNPNVAAKYKEFWNEDIADITELTEQYFVIQQRLLENFLSSIQIELENIS